MSMYFNIKRKRQGGYERMTMCTICGGTIRNDRCIKCGIVYKKYDYLT